MERVSRESTFNTLKDILKWNQRAEATRNALERQGKHILLQTESTRNGRTEDITILSDGNQYVVRVNGRDVITSRSRDMAISSAEKRGYLDDITLMELRRGKAAADRLRQIKRIRAMLERR